MAAPKVPREQLEEGDRSYTAAGSGGGSGTSLTIEEVDGSPTATCTKLVLPNGTLAIAAGVATYTPAAVAQSFQLALSDLTTAITVASSVGYFDAPFACTLTEVIWTVLTASSSGLPQLDVKKNGTTMLSTKVTIDATETSSLTAATPPVISVTSIAKGDRITFDHVAAGTGAKGSQVTLNVTRP